MAYKSGFVAVIGKPNVGKSSLINAVLGQKVSITSPKPHTTRNKILGILNTPDYQMIFVDTPGVQNTQSQLGKYMAKAVDSGKKGADCIVILLDATSVTDTDYKLISSNQNSKVPVYVVVNKIDLATYERLYPILAKLNGFTWVKRFFTISALKGDRLTELVAELAKNLPEGEPLYPTDTCSDRPLKFLATETIREKALLYLQQEIPHSVAVEITQYLEGATKTSIFADIICENERHKQIIIGEGGSMLKKIGMSARKELEKMLAMPVDLKLFVKVRSGWKNSPGLLAELGYNDKDL